ncbi:MAG: hypothetical protein MUC87_08565 [Bacteroidia bacterium]|jgi:hypothetical protein|nr:hypothetical protein [Bacteroidia bacterium]
MIGIKNLQNINQSKSNAANISKTGFAYAAPSNVHLIQRKITIIEIDNNSFEPQEALILLESAYNDYFSSDFLLSHKDEFLDILSEFSKANSTFNKVHDLFQAFEQHHRTLLAKQQMHIYKSSSSSSSSSSPSSTTTSSSSSSKSKSINLSNSQPSISATIPLITPSSLTTPSLTNIKTKPDYKDFGIPASASSSSGLSNSGPLSITNENAKSSAKSSSISSSSSSSSNSSSAFSQSDKSSGTPINNPQVSGSHKASASTSNQIKDYNKDSEANYRFSMAHGSRWAGEAEAAVLADSYGVRFRIYYFENAEETVPQYDITVGSGGPIYALHFSPQPGHYSLLVHDPAGIYLLNGIRYKFVDIPGDGHCLFAAGFRAVKGRKATPEDIRSLRAVVAAMVPQEVVEQMIVELGGSVAKEKTYQEDDEEFEKIKDEENEEEEDENDFEMSDLSKKGADSGKSKLFMSRINYLLNRYPNLFYGLRSQHSDFGSLFGGFSETRQMFFYNDALVPKLPDHLQEEPPIPVYEFINAEKTPKEPSPDFKQEPESTPQSKPSKSAPISKPAKSKSSSSSSNTNDKESVRFKMPVAPQLPEIDTLDEETLENLVQALSEYNKQMYRYIDEVDPYLRQRYSKPSKESSNNALPQTSIAKGIISGETASTRHGSNFSPLLPYNFYPYEINTREAMEHSNLNDKAMLNQINFIPSVSLKDKTEIESNQSVLNDTNTLSNPAANDIEIPDSDKSAPSLSSSSSLKQPAKPTPEQIKEQQRRKDLMIKNPELLLGQDIDAVKHFNRMYQYSSNDPDSNRYLLPENQERINSEVRKLRKDEKIGKLRKGVLKFNNNHAEQLLVSSIAWEAITTQALELAYKESILNDRKNKPNIKNIESKHVFTIVINRSSCPSCTDALIAAIRLFWNICGELFDLNPDEAQKTLNHIFSFELSVTGMYSSSNKNDTTTLNDIQALEASGWVVGLHHDKQGGISSQGYALAEALTGEKNVDTINNNAGRGQPSVSTISTDDKHNVSNIRKLKKETLKSRGPENRAGDINTLTQLLNSQQNGRGIGNQGIPFLESVIDEICNNQDVVAANFKEAAEPLINALREEAGGVRNNQDQMKQLRSRFIACLNAIYDLLDKHLKDNNNDNSSNKK